MRTRTRLLTLLGMMLATMLIAAGPALAVDKKTTMYRLHGGLNSILDGNMPGSNGNCANDIGGLKQVNREKICIMKFFGVWSGSNFYPNSSTDRDELAKWMRRATKGGADWNQCNNMNCGGLTVGEHGNGADQFIDVPYSPSAEAHGVGFMNYHGIDTGKPSGSSTYKPNDGVSLNGLESRKNTWVNLYD